MTEAELSPFLSKLDIWKTLGPDEGSIFGGRPMSDVGQSQKLARLNGMSVLPSILLQNSL
jgi:hypothetical protein